MSNADTRGMIRGIQNGEVRKVVLDAIERGWRCEVTKSTHLKLTHPSGRSTWSTTTKGKQSSGRNLLQTLRRIEKEAS